MKPYLKSLTLFVIVSILLFSCSVEKRLYNKGYSVEWKSNSLPEKASAVANEKNDAATISDEIHDVSVEEIEFPVEESIEEPSDELTPCDSIRMRNGNLKVGTVTEINATEVRYKNCDIKGPIYVLQKADVKSIKYADGKEEVYVIEDAAVGKPKPSSTDPQFEGFGFVGFLASIVGLFIAGLPMAIVAIVLGSISIGRTVSHPSKYTGKAFGVLSLLFGFVLLILMLVILL